MPPGADFQAPDADKNKEIAPHHAPGFFEDNLQRPYGCCPTRKHIFPKSNG